MQLTFRVSTIGSRVSLHGYSNYINMWGPSGNNVEAVEVVLPYNAESVWLGRGSKVPVESQVGLNVLPLFFRSKGALGVITKVTEKIINKPQAFAQGMAGFKTLEEGVKAYIELKKRTGNIWRIGLYNYWFLKQVPFLMIGEKWPNDVESVVYYDVFGDKEIVDAMMKRAQEIVRQCGGFWRLDMPDQTFLERMIGTPEKALSLSALYSERMTKGGVGNKMLIFDPAIPDIRLPRFLREFFAFVSKVSDGEHYPALAKAVSALLDPTATLSYGWSVVFGRFIVNWRKIDDEIRKEWINWFEEYCELVWRYGGTISAVLGSMYVPRDMRAKFIKKEVGEKEYEFMKLIKRTLDPNNIMNPYALP